MNLYVAWLTLTVGSTDTKGMLLLRGSRLRFTAGLRDREGRIEDIGEYCLRDVRATGQLYEKLAPTLLPMFKGGPGA